MKKFTGKTLLWMNRTLAGVRNNAEGFIRNEDGETNLVAILLIIVVTVALVAIFKDRITDLINTIFDAINEAVEKI